MERRRIIYRGTVQGVGFRWAAVQAARPCAVTGYVRNADDGSVEVVVEGAAEELERFAGQLEERMSGYIETREVEELAATGEFGGFTVEH